MSGAGSTPTDNQHRGHDLRPREPAWAPADDRTDGRQDLKTLYRRYRLGFVWTLGEPFLLAMLMWAVFSFIFAGGRGIGLQPFIVFLITGIYPFTWLADDPQEPRAFIRFGDVLESSPLSPVTWPLRMVLVGMFEFITSIPIILVFIFVGGAGLTWGTALFPVAMAMQFLLCLGFATFQAGLALRWPDIEVFASVMTRAFFWGSPILWSQKNFPEWMVPCTCTSIRSTACSISTVPLSGRRSSRHGPTTRCPSA